MGWSDATKTPRLIIKYIAQKTFNGDANQRMHPFSTLPCYSLSPRHFRDIILIASHLRTHLALVRLEFPPPVPGFFFHCLGFLAPWLRALLLLKELGSKQSASTAFLSYNPSRVLDLT